jgi:hypothetical protein
VNGALASYISRGGRQILVFLPDDEPARGVVGRALAARLARMARSPEGHGGLLVAEINGIPTADHPFAPFLIDAGFNPSAMGFQMRSSAGSRDFAAAPPSPSSVVSEPLVRRGRRHA